MDDHRQNEPSAEPPPGAVPASLARSPAPGLPVARLIAPPPRPIDNTAVPGAPAPRGPWGLWATAGWCVLGVMLLLIVEGVLLVALLVAAQLRSPGNLDGDGVAAVERILDSGWFLAVSTIVSTPVVLLYLVLVICLRRMTVQEYLGLRMPSSRQTGRWLLVLVMLMTGWDGLSLAVGREIVPAFMVDAYRTAGSVWLLVLAVVVAAPWLEELVFRGFVYAGIAGSRLGVVPAIVMTAVLWAVLHVQYDWYGLSFVLVGGLLLGWARAGSGSTLLPILLHAVMNGVATIEVAVAVECLR